MLRCFLLSRRNSEDEAEVEAPVVSVDAADEDSPGFEVQGMVSMDESLSVSGYEASWAAAQSAIGKMRRVEVDAMAARMRRWNFPRLPLRAGRSVYRAE